MQMGDRAITRSDDGTLVTDRNADLINAQVLSAGYSVRHIETWHSHDVIFLTAGAIGRHSAHHSPP